MGPMQTGLNFTDRITQYVAKWAEWKTKPASPSKGHVIPHTDFIKEFADFLSELVLAADKVLIVGDFNIHVDNEKDALGSAFIDILNSIGVRQHVSGPTHCRNHTLDLILSHGIDVSGVEILQQSDDISDHYLVLCKLHIAKTVNSCMVEPSLLAQKTAL